MIGYVSKDKDGSLYFHYTLPVRDEDNEWWWSDDDALFLKTNIFPEFDNITYDDEPIKVELNIKRV